MPYALSVFLPESGLAQAPLGKKELVDLLQLGKDEHYMSVAGRNEHSPLIMDIVEVIQNFKSLRPNKVSSSCQTEDALSEHLSIE